MSLDVVRWRERPHWGRGELVLFVIGVLTTLLVLVAWLVNLFVKPMATDDPQAGRGGEGRIASLGPHSWSGAVVRRN